MPIKTVIENTDGLNEALVPFYTEQDGKFYLQIEGVREHPDVLNLSNAYERVKADRDTAKAERDRYKMAADSLPEDFDPAKWAKLKDGKPDDSALVAIRQQLEAERDEFKTKYETANETARINALARDLTDALSAEGVTDPLFIRSARALLSPEVKIAEDGKPYVDTDMGPVSVPERVKRWVASEGKSMVDPGRGGGAKGGSGSGAPLSKDDFLKMGDSERSGLYRSDPETFKRLTAN